MTLTCLGRSPSHSQQLLMTLNSQRSSGTFCDVVVCVDNKMFPLHRCVLASVSPKLSMMVSRMASTDNILHLKDVSLIGFKKIVKYIYTGFVKLNLEYAHHVLFAARSLQLRKLERVCLDYFQKVLHINPDVRVMVSKLPERKDCSKNSVVHDKSKHDADAPTSTYESMDTSGERTPGRSNSGDLSRSKEEKTEDITEDLDTDIGSSINSNDYNCCDLDDKDSLKTVVAVDEFPSSSSSSSTVELNEDISKYGGTKVYEDVNKYDRNTSDHHVCPNPDVQSCCMTSTQRSADAMEEDDSNSHTPENRPFLTELWPFHTEHDVTFSEQDKDPDVFSSSDLPLTARGGGAGSPQCPSESDSQATIILNELNDSDMLA